MSGYCTPPHGETATPSPKTPYTIQPNHQLATPITLDWDSPGPTTWIEKPRAPTVLTQTEVNANPKLKRLQQDLLILTGFNDNYTLYWRPAWFSQTTSANRMWTLHNPPNVVTEALPNDCKGVQMYSRRMRRVNDPPPQYIASWDHWKRYCDLYGVPFDFLCEEQVRLMRVGLLRSSDESLCSQYQYQPFHAELTVPSTSAIPSLSGALRHKQLCTRSKRLQHASAPQVPACSLDVVIQWIRLC